LFVYGSLVAEAGRSPRVAELEGSRPCWGVAMDNRQDIPGYKYYLDENGDRPDVFVAFLDVQPDRTGSVKGCCTPVTREDLRRLDRRERNYARVEVTDAIGDPLGRTWMYVGSPSGRRRLSLGRETRRAVISREYFDRVEAGFRALGSNEYAALRGSSALDGLPIRDLTRVDLPE
jgi:gamma-glutamylcyclotransferase (GGCT)/AIG2-like uncharacterized protein YtfP